ncbi:MAG: hypothetical protein ACOZE5_12490 [Verrucomicrobiota bacterium]
MNYRLSPLLLALTILVTGCATTGPVYQLPKDAKSGTLVGRNFMVFIPTDKVRISFVEIDGALVKPSAWSGPLEEVPVTPGIHKITFGLEGFQFVFAQDEMELKVEAGHRYKFHARKVGIAFDVEVKDESSESIIFTKRVSGTKGSAPAVIPIFIPAK